MSELTIKTDYKWKNFLYGYELTEKEKTEFDWMNAEELDTGNFFRYHKRVYSVNEFMNLGKESPFPKPWHGYHGEGFFCGVLLEISEDGEQYRVGNYYS